jgi:hypothetical protein
MVTRTRDNTHRVREFPDHVALHTTLETESCNFSEANSHPQWRQAMETELQALALNQT